jgi:DNA polymerase-3 subunit epsilon
LVIHNAPFDIAFLNAEVERLAAKAADAPERVDTFCDITDSLVLARRKHPGQKNSLDALCRRYMVDNSQRELHGALLDAEILADVYLLMTGGQDQMFSNGADQEQKSQSESNQQAVRLDIEQLRVVQAKPEELAAHEAMLELMDKHSDGQTLWRR